MHIKDQIVLVTGGARGLGLAISKALLHEGARVVVNFFNSRESAEQLFEQYPRQVFLYQADVTNAAEVEKLFEQANEYFGESIHAVINNALVKFEFNGDARPKVEDLQWDQMQNQLDGALKAALNTTKSALKGMKNNHFGRIVNIGTNLVQNPVVPYHDYTAAKSALLAFTRTTAHELGEFGININMLSGGLLQTTDASKSTPEQVFNFIAQSTPLRRVITPEEFAAAILMFLSPYATAVTGQNLIVDGGLVKG